MDRNGTHSGDRRDLQESKILRVTGVQGVTGDAASRPGISVKLSALHPRFEAVSRELVLTELVPKARELARRARAHGLNCTARCAAGTASGSPCKPTRIVLPA